MEWVQGRVSRLVRGVARGTLTVCPDFDYSQVTSTIVLPDSTLLFFVFVEIWSDPAVCQLRGLLGQAPHYLSGSLYATGLLELPSARTA